MRLSILLCAMAFPAIAQTDFTAMTQAERAAFGVEVRALLMDEPSLAADEMAGPNYAAEAYRDEADADLALLNDLSSEVLEGSSIALFVSPDCPTCVIAERELIDISNRYGIKFKLHDMSTPATIALAERLGMAEAPFYVMPTMILRGHMPDIVLVRYLTK